MSPIDAMWHGLSYLLMLARSHNPTRSYSDCKRARAGDSEPPDDFLSPVSEESENHRSKVIRID
jgi:hypothetical protein